MTISHRNVRVNEPTFSPSMYLSAWLGVHLYVRVSPDGADSSTKVDLSRRVIRLSGNSTLSGQSVTSNGAGGSPAEAVIRLFGDVCDRAGPFLKFEKNRHMAARKPRFGCVFTLNTRFSVLKP